MYIFFVIVASSVYFHFKTSAPSQSEIFFVIVVSFVYLHFKTSTPSQSEIFFVTVIFSLYWPFKYRRYIPEDRTRNKKAFQKNILLWEGVLVLKGQYIHLSRENK